MGPDDRPMPNARDTAATDESGHTASDTAPVVTDGLVRFGFPDDGDVDGVRLEVDFDPGVNPEFVREGGRWALSWPRLAVDRIEYQFTVRRGDRTDWTTDPANHRTVANPFGPKSEICFPEYRPPAWLRQPQTDDIQEIATDSGGLDRAVPVRLWSPAGLPPDQPAPLLLAHDGSDLADRGSMLRWASELARRHPLRVALLDPAAGLRDTWYAANPAYVEHVGATVLPALRSRVAASRIIGLGASLGAVAMLMIQRANFLDAAVLQSGSYFTERLDPQESGYPHFSALCAAVFEIVADPGPPVPVVITAGTVEENRANNEAMAAALSGQGYSVDLRIVRDAHTMIGWRDAWFPAVNLLVQSLEQGG